MIPQNYYWFSLFVSFTCFPIIPSNWVTSPGNPIVDGYDIKIQTNMPDTYQGTVTMSFRLEGVNSNIHINGSKNYEVTAARLYFRVPWGQIKREDLGSFNHVNLSSKLYPETNTLVFEMARDDQIGYGYLQGSNRFMLEVNFTGRFSRNHEGFHASIVNGTSLTYAVMKLLPGPYYAFPCADLSAYPTINFELAKDREYVNISSVAVPQGTHPVQSLYTIGMFQSLFYDRTRMSRELSVEGYIHDDELLSTGMKFLAIDAGFLFMKELDLMCGDRRPYKSLYVIMIPATEPNYLNAWGMIFYHDHEATIENFKLHDILMLPTDALDKGETFDPSPFTHTAVHTALLRVAEDIILQYFAPIHRIDFMLCKEIFSAGLMEFLKYKLVDETFPYFNSMDTLYLKYVQPFLWENVLQIVRVENENDTVMMEDIAAARMFNDLLLPNSYKLQGEPSFWDVMLHLDAPVMTRDEFIGNASVYVHYMYLARDPNPTQHYRMLEWINSSNYPLIQLEAQSNGYIFIVKNFFTNKVEPSWRVPIFIDFHDVKTVSQFIFSYFAIAEPTSPLKQSIGRIDKPLLPFDWMLVNAGRASLFRVNYTENGWEKLRAALQMENFGGIPYINRAQLIDDSMALAYNHNYPWANVFRLCNYLHKEQHPLPWSVAVRHFKFIYQRMQGQQRRARLAEFMQHKLNPLFNTLGFESLEDSKNDVQSRVIDTMGIIGDQRMLQHADEWVTNFTESSYRTLAFDPVQKAICCATLRNAMAEQKILEHINGILFPREPIEATPEDAYTRDERNSLIQCLSCTRSREALENLIEKTVLSTHLSLEQVQYIQNAVHENVLMPDASSIITWCLIKNGGYHRDLTENPNLHEQKTVYGWFEVAAKLATEKTFPALTAAAAGYRNKNYLSSENFTLLLKYAHRNQHITEALNEESVHRILDEFIIVARKIE